MSSFTVLQISDTHLSPRTQYFHENNELVLETLKASSHDFIIHTGDITLDGIRYEEDYQFCRDFFGQSGKAILYIPGNHDIGDNPQLSQPVDANGSRISPSRVERFNRFYGRDRWSVDQGSWRLLGISSLLIGSGLPQEQEQYDWIRQQLSTLGDRHLALFTHQPLFIDDTQSSELTYWTVDPKGWPELQALMQHPQLKLIASGHLHQQRSREVNGVRLEWCSSIAFTTREELVPEMGGDRQVGYLDHRFHEDGRVETQVQVAPDFVNSYLDDMLLEVYPKF